ncbi:MAG: 4-hydroxy-tetrahydrodipicolinate synthase [Bacteroidia bacterium]|nr:4-hydroxy-tetrahydrodipicolinate synthase [Bacteroidia bacterium]
MKGTGLALVTPFKADFSIDFDALSNLIEHVITGGVEYVVALGTTGESVTLSKDEKKQVYQFIQQQVKGRVLCVAGLGGNNTAELTDYIKSFDFTGYDAVLSVSPYYNKPSQEGIYQHFMQVAEASAKPIILYNVPGRSGSNMTADTTLRLAKANSKFIAVKEASGNAEQFMDLIHQAPAGFSVVSGDDNLTVPFISMGMTGVISVIGQAYPKKFSDMVRAALNNDIVTARTLHFELYDVMKSIYLDGNPGGIKALLSLMGICQNIVRLPLVPVNNGAFETIKKHFDETKA